MATLHKYGAIVVITLFCCVFVACSNNESKIYGEWSTISKETRIYFKKDHTGVVNLFTNMSSNSKPNNVVNFKWQPLKDGTFKLVDTHNNSMLFKLNGNKIETEYKGNILEYSKVDENPK